jgi:hypothetical protein
LWGLRTRKLKAWIVGRERERERVKGQKVFEIAQSKK